MAADATAASPSRAGEGPGPKTPSNQLVHLDPATVPLPGSMEGEETMIGLFVMGVILWVIGSLMEKHELAERRKHYPNPNAEEEWIKAHGGRR
jgi:hypothetical protein